MAAAVNRRTGTVARGVARVWTPAMIFGYGLLAGGFLVWLAMERQLPPATAASIAATAEAADRALNAPARAEAKPPIAVTRATQASAPVRRTTRPAPRTRSRTATARETRASIEPGADVIFRGGLQVLSQPPGARVLMNGDVVGRTPLDLQRLPVGSRAVRLEMDGFEPWSSAISVVANERTAISVRLAPQE
jgi:hypothetical protein